MLAILDPMLTMVGLMLHIVMNIILFFACGAVSVLGDQARKTALCEFEGGEVSLNNGLEPNYRWATFWGGIQVAGAIGSFVFLFWIIGDIIELGGVLFGGLSFLVGG